MSTHTLSVLVENKPGVLSRGAELFAVRRRYLPGWWPTDGDVVMFDPGKVTVSRYRYRGNIATPWSTATAA